MVTSSRIAIVHERLTEFAGSEQVVEQIAVEWPTARVYVPIAGESLQATALRDRVEVSRLDRLHRLTGRRSHAPLMPLFPAHFSRLRLEDCDVVVISHHSAALAAVHATDKPTVAYVHSPARWAWDPRMRAGEASSLAGRAALSALAARIRRAESRAAPNVTTIVANSTVVRERIRSWWQRDSLVVHPPVDTEFYTPDWHVEREDFFLLAGRLVPYKRPELAIAAAREAGVRLIVAGDGRMGPYCRAMAGARTQFLGRVSDADMLALQRRARALLMPGVEDFGIVPVEAMACGTPVLAVGEGGALDTVVPDLTGQLIQAGDDDAVVHEFAAALRGFDDRSFDGALIRRQAERFSQARFRNQMRDVVDSVA